MARYEAGIDDRGRPAVIDTTDGMYQVALTGYKTYDVIEGWPTTAQQHVDRVVRLLNGESD